MVTKKELIDALSGLKDDDTVIVALLTPPDEDADGFSETDTPSSDDKDGGENYIECEVEAIEVVESDDNSNVKALLLYARIPSEDDDTIFVNDDGHYVNNNDEYITKEGEPTDTPVKADPEDIEEDA